MSKTINLKVSCGRVFRNGFSRYKWESRAITADELAVLVGRARKNEFGPNAVLSIWPDRQQLDLDGRVYCWTVNAR